MPDESLQRQNRVVILGERSKVLKTPGRFIGSIETREIEKMVVTTDLKSVEEMKIRFNTGLFKIVEEVFDNALDECKRHNGQTQKGNRIDFIIDKDSKWITISDNGNGIPNTPAENEDGSASDLTMYQAAWNKLGAGTNFDGYTEEDSDARGQNGEGVCLTNLFSKEFRGYTQYKDNFISLISVNNMETTEITEVKKVGPTGTTVQFLPDYERFGETHFSRDHQFVVLYYFAILSIQYPQFSFYFNGINIKYSMDQLISGITHGKKAESEMIKVPGLTVIILPSNKTKFSQFINGSDADAGGNPIEWVTKKVVEGFLSALPKKYNKIKASHVESKLHVIAMFDGMVKPRFEGQTKNKCITPYNQFRTTIDEKALDWKAFGQTLVKNKKISDNIIIYHEIELKAEEKKKAVGDEKERKKEKQPAKYKPPRDKNTYLIASEGDSAIGSLMTNCDRINKGYFPLGGKPLNAIKARKPKSGTSSKKTVTSYSEFKELCSKSILDISFTEENKKMAFDFFVMASDADPDGIHIAGLYLGFFYHVFDRMLINKQFLLMQTPIVMSKNRKTEVTEHVFFTQLEYDTWIQEDPRNMTKYIHEYKKGLGSISKEEWDELFQMYKFEDLLVTIYLRDPEIDNDGFVEDVTILESWLSEDSDFRKRAITNYSNFVNENNAVRELEGIMVFNEDGSDIEEPEMVAV